jgi:hypothetical protein
MTRIARRHRWLAASAVALAIALLPEVAAAQSPAPPTSRPQDTSPQALFKRLDTNMDGQVSKQEAARLPSVATRWEALDRNKDGALSRDEFIAGFRA